MNYKQVVFLFLMSLSCYAAESDTYRQQFAYNPDDYRALYNAGVAAFKENNLERAQESFDFLKKIDAHKPWDALQGEQIFYNAGNTEMKLKTYEPAIASFEAVLKYNPQHELARKKLELAKKLLEEQKQQEQKQDDKKQDKDKNKDDNKEDKQDQKQDKKDNTKQDGSENDQQDKQDQEEDSKDQQKPGDKNEQQEKDSKSGDKQDDQKKDKDQKNKEQKPESGKDEQPQEQQSQSGQEKKEKPEPELTQQEQRILAYAQKMDEDMHDALNEKTLKKAQGVVRDHHNW